jgi:Na+-transporting NADH:ubiquinone oxidoreductase subunit NqrB
MVLTFDEDGLIIGAKSYLRPQQVVGLLREFLFASAAAKLPQEYWDASPQGFAGDPALLKKNVTGDKAPKSSN